MSEFDPSVLTRLLERFIDSWARGNLHTIMPAIVTAFNPGPPIPTVTVQPALQRVYEMDEQPRNLSPIEDVPVVFPGSGNMIMTFEVEVGTSVVLLVSERAYNAWLQTEEPGDPGLDHMFDLSDSFALPSLWPLTREFGAAVASGRVEIRDLAGTTKLGITSDEISGELSDGTLFYIKPDDIKLETASGPRAALDSDSASMSLDDGSNITIDGDGATIETTGGYVSLSSSGTMSANGNLEVLP